VLANKMRMQHNLDQRESLTGRQTEKSLREFRNSRELVQSNLCLSRSRIAIPSSTPPPAVCASARIPGVVETLKDVVGTIGLRGPKVGFIQSLTSTPRSDRNTYATFRSTDRLTTTDRTGAGGRSWRTGVVHRQMQTSSALILDLFGVVVPCPQFPLIQKALMPLERVMMFGLFSQVVHFARIHCEIT
jgi:hypothetical protein